MKTERFDLIRKGGTQVTPAAPSPVVLPNSGGSICNDVFRDVLGVPTVWIPLSYAGCCQHAPDEHILWPLMRQGMEIIAGLYWDLGDPATGVPKSHHS